MLHPVWLTMNRHNFSSWNHIITQYPELEGIEIGGPHLNTGSKILLIATYYFIITYRLLQLKIPVEQVKLILFSPSNFIPKWPVYIGCFLKLIFIISKFNAQESNLSNQEKNKNYFEYFDNFILSGMKINK